MPHPVDRFETSTESPPGASCGAFLPPAAITTTERSAAGAASLENSSHGIPPLIFGPVLQEEPIEPFDIGIV